MSPENESRPPIEDTEAGVPNVLDVVTDENLASWLSAENLSMRQTRTVEGFEVTASIDGGGNPEIEVSLVTIRSGTVYPQHVHKNSDAYFIIVSGSATFLSGRERKLVQAGERISIPRGTPHGFHLEAGETLQFVSVQSPPIRDSQTGEEDLVKLTDQI
jgi:quercetin dioxygenase-like cupin family protein